MPGTTKPANAATAAMAASAILRVFMRHPPWHRALTASVSCCSLGTLASFGRAARRQLSAAEQLSRREPSNVRAYNLYKAWHSRVVPRRHDVHTRNARHTAQFTNDVGANPSTLHHWIGRLLHSADQRVRDNRPEQFLLDPARRFRRTQRHDADQERQFAGQALLREPSHVPMHDTCTHAALCLH